MKSITQRGNILIVDDEDSIGRLLSYKLKTEGFEVHTYSSVKEVYIQDLEQMRIVIINERNFDTTVVDLLRTMKSNPKLENIPVILCAAPVEEEIVIKAFDLGIDDFVRKPYSLREILARINAVLRRYPFTLPVKTNKVRQDITIKNLGLNIDTTNHKVILNGDVVPLTKTEYSILEYLVRNPNKFFTRNEIFNEVWKDDSSVNVRIVDTNISRLRKKLGESSKHLINRYGLGYAFVNSV